MQRRGLISNVGLWPTAILNQHFQSTLLGGGHKKEYAVYARENDDNYGRPLMWYQKEEFLEAGAFQNIQSTQDKWSEKNSQIP